MYLPLREALHRQHIYCLASMRSKYHYEFMGWDGLLLLNISHNNISKMFKEGELETNIQGIHFIINYKILLKAVTPA